MESRKLMNTIEFKFLRNSYPLNENLLCYFAPASLNVTVPQVGDWIGLFKVGWTNVGECKVRKLISIENVESNRRAQIDYSHVIIDQMHLPRETEGLYQFVYVTNDDVVRGVSRPFEFEVEPRMLRDELKEMRRDMWEGVKDRLMWVNGEERRWNPMVEEERERDCLIGSRSIRSDINNNNNRIIETLESELVNEICQSNVMEKLHEDSVINRLLQKYLMCVRTRKEEDFVKRFEELFIENNRLNTILTTRICEIDELRKEIEELRMINSELVSKVSLGERRMDKFERRSDNVRKLMKLREEVKRWTPMMQMNEDVMTQSCRLDEVDRMGSLEARNLMKLVEELRCENEVLRGRCRLENEGKRSLNQELSIEFPLTSKTTIIKEKSSTCMPKVTSQPEYLSLIETRQPICQERCPSITVSTGIPEVSSKSLSLNCNGKLTGPMNEQNLRETVKEQIRSRPLEEYMRTRTIAEHLKNELERLNSKLTDIRDVKEMTNEICGKEMKLPTWWFIAPQTTEEAIQKHGQCQQQKQILQQCNEQNRKQVKEQLANVTPGCQLSTICPVCGIAVSKELNQTEFELHVNSHFTD